MPDRPPKIACVTLSPAVDYHLGLSGTGPVRGATARAVTRRFRAGGKGINVARCLADYPETVSFYFIGKDFTSAYLNPPKTGKAVCIETATESVRLNVKITDGDHVMTEINARSEVTPEDIERMEAALFEELAAGDYLLLCGSVPQGAPEDIYARWIGRAHALHIFSALDTSGEFLRTGIAAQPDLIKPNHTEAAALLDMTEVCVLRDPSTAARELRERFSYRGKILLSLGKQGAVYSEAPGAMVARPVETVIPGPTAGAGDAMLAGVITALIDQLPPEKCLERAARFAADSLLRNPVSDSPDRPKNRSRDTASER